jgi:hypothetical protein
MKWLLVCLLLLLPGLAHAQTAGPTSCIATLSLTTARVLGSTATIGPNATGCQWPANGKFPGFVFVTNEDASTGNAYICPVGDTPANQCSTSNGLERAKGKGWGFYQPSSEMTFVSDGTATVQIQW